jgi:hypothetical protein
MYTCAASAVTAVCNGAMPFLNKNDSAITNLWQAAGTSGGSLLTGLGQYSNAVGAEKQKQLDSTNAALDAASEAAKRVGSQADTLLAQLQQSAAQLLDFINKAADAHVQELQAVVRA